MIKYEKTDWAHSELYGILRFDSNCKPHFAFNRCGDMDRTWKIDVYKIDDRLYFNVSFYNFSPAKRDNMWYSVEKFDEKELEEFKELLMSLYNDFTYIDNLEYITRKEIKKYFKKHPNIAKEKYAKQHCYVFDNHGPLGNEENTLSAFLTYGVDKLLEYISNDGIEIYDNDDWGQGFFLQLYTKEEVDLMKQALKIIIGLLDEEQKDKIREQVKKINNNLYTDPWGRDCWKKTINPNEIGLGA